MFARTANTSAGLERAVLAQRKCALAGVVTKRDGFLGEILHHAHADGVIQFVHRVRVVRWIPGNAALQDHNGERGA